MELVDGERFLQFDSENTQKELRLWMDQDQTTLNFDYDNSEDPSDAIRLLDILDVRYGCETDTFYNVIKNQSYDQQRLVWVWEEIKQFLSWITWNTYGPIVTPVLPTHCLSVIYLEDNTCKTLDLQSNDVSTALHWCRALKLTLGKIRQRHDAKDHRHWLMAKFHKADLNHSQSLDLQETYQLLADLNTVKGDQEIKTLFDLANTNLVGECGQQVLNFDEFAQFYELLVQRPELSQIYRKYATADGFMNAGNLEAFFSQEQCETDVSFTDLMNRYEPSEDLKKQGKLSLKGFIHLLNSPLFDALKVNDVEDMHKPLYDYYICSSHNTYLEGDELIGRSTIQGYIAALEKGCRCLELDLWEGADGELVIYHGLAFPTIIPVRDVLRYGIAPYAFTYSPYPLILSVGNHLPVEQQDVFVDCLKSIFDDALYTGDEKAMSELPSPHQLRGKVIIKSDITQKLSPKFAAIVNICKAVWFEDCKHSRRNHQCYHVSSLSEIKAKHQIETAGCDLIQHTERQLMHIYPAGFGITSTNFDPVPYWNAGCQMVALNVQTSDVHVATNLGRFRATPNCGFVLKPKKAIFKSIQNLQSAPAKMSIQLRVISGQNLPTQNVGEPISPCVDIQIRGHSADDTKVSKTRIVPDNGLNPFWDASFDFSIKVPELAVISFTVNNTNDVLASFAMPVMNLSAGYRHIALTTSDGTPLPSSSIFIHSKIEIFDNGT